MECCKNCGSSKGTLNGRGKRSLVKGFCAKCYTRFMKYGDPNAKKKAFPDGRSSTSEYHIWAEMKARCQNKNNKRFSSYGGRGIQVCDRWAGVNGFDNFLKDMGKRPGQRYSLDRINNDGDYCPENCRWATPNEQAANKRNNTKVPGVTYSKKDDAWLARLYYKKKLALCRQFKNYEEAVAARRLAELTIKEE